jgi:predicted HTH transcriptional regulator
MEHVLENGSVTSGWCLKEFGVVYNTAFRDLGALVRLGVLKKEGADRGTRYTLHSVGP